MKQLLLSKKQDSIKTMDNSVPFPSAYTTLNLIVESFWSTTEM